jgi:hypothetical protein
MMFYCPECGEYAATVKGQDCKGCAYLESEERQEYLYTTGEGRAELLGQNDLSPDFYGDDYPDDFDGYDD